MAKYGLFGYFLSFCFCHIFKLFEVRSINSQEIVVGKLASTASWFMLTERSGCVGSGREAIFAGVREANLSWHIAVIHILQTFRSIS